jgi:hypothetical protein
MKKITIKVKTETKNFNTVLFVPSSKVFEVVKNFKADILKREKITSFTFSVLNTRKNFQS